jgi:hypothetical protein
MKRIGLLLLSAVLCGCGPVGTPAPMAIDRFAGLPKPSQLTQAAPRTASGSHAPMNRTLVTPGDAYSATPGFSANAELGPDGDAILHGSTTALSYVMYELSSAKVDHTAQLTQLGGAVRWDGPEPAAPAGVYVGLPDHTDDRWYWVDARMFADDHWETVFFEGLHGLDPSSGTNSFIAVVNFSSQDAHVDELRLRFNLPTSILGDEFLYYTSRDPAATSPLMTSVSRVDNAGGVPQLLFEADATTPVAFLGPVVIGYTGGWRLLYARNDFASPVETYLCNMDGTGSILAGSDLSDDIYSAGWNYGDDHGLIIHFNTGSGELWALDADLASFEYGRLSQPGDRIQTAVWDLSVDTAVTEYAAIASVEVDSFENRNALISYSGNAPFNIDALPQPIYLPTATEDARDPFMVELANFFGDPEYWIYFACRGRDDATYNIYRINRITLADPEPVIVDAAYELRYPSTSPNGRYLAYMRAPAGSSFTDNSEIVVADLLDPQSSQVVASDGVAFQYWYDPTP